jgi:hypothetical protein
LAAPIVADAHTHPAIQIAFFMHTVRTKANNIRFMHQSLCSPRISTLLKAINRGFLKGCPNLTAHGVKKYLNPSPAMAKGHIRRPQQGIRSTHCVPPVHEPLPDREQSYNAPTVLSTEIADDISKDSIPMPPQLPNGMPHANIIESDNDSVASIFVFTAFADTRTGMLYSDLTGTFPFMSLKGNVCFLVLYHYESNAILALPITNFTNKTILAAYQR